MKKESEKKKYRLVSEAKRFLLGQAKTSNGFNYRTTASITGEIVEVNK